MFRSSACRWVLLILLFSLPLSVRLAWAQGIVMPQKPGAPQYTASQQAYLAEKAKALATIDAVKGKNLQGALNVAYKMLEGDRKEFGDMSEQVADTLNVLALLLWSANQMEQSITAKNDIHTVKTALYGKDDWRALKARWEAAQWALLARSPDMARYNTQIGEMLARGIQLINAGHYDEAIATAQKADKLIADLYDPDFVPPHLEALRVFALAYNLQSKHEAAEAIFKERGELIAGWFGRVSPDYIKNLTDRGRNIIEPTLKEQYFREAVELCDQIQGFDPSYLAFVLESLAVNYVTLQRFAQAKEAITRGISIEKEVNGDHTFEMTLMRLTDAVIDRGLQKYPESEATFKVVTKHLEKAPPKHATTRIRAHREMALLYREMRKYDLAAQQLTAAMDFIRTTFGENSIEYASLVTVQGILEADQQHYDRAVTLYEKSLAIARKIADANTFPVVDPAEGLSRCLRFQAAELNRNKDYAAARKKLQRAVEVTLPLIGERRESTFLQTAVAIQDQLEKFPPDLVKFVLEAEQESEEGHKAFAAGNLAEAEQHFRKSIELQERLGGLQISKIVGDTYYALGELLRLQGKFEDSLTPLASAQAAYETAFKDKPLANEIANSFARQGDSCEKLGKLDNAIRFYSRAIEIYRAMGAENVTYATFLIPNLTRCYLAQGDSARALATGRQYVDEIARIRGKDSSPYADALHQLAQAEFHAGNFKQAREHFSQAIEIEAGREPDSPKISNYRRWLVACDLRLGNRDVAIAELEKLLAKAREANDKGGMIYAASELAAQRRRKGDLDAAETLAEEALALIKEAQDPDPTRLNTVWLTLNQVFYAQIVEFEIENKYNESVALREKLIAKHAEYFGTDTAILVAHRHELEMAKKLAALSAEDRQKFLDARVTIYKSKRNVTAEGAVEALAAAQQIEKLLGDKSLVVAAAYRQAAESCPSTSPECDPLFRKALELCLAAVGEDSPHTADFRREYGKYLRHAGHYDAAAEQLTKSLEISSHHPAETSPDVIARTRLQLAEAYACLGQLGSATEQLNQAEPALLAAQGDSANRVYLAALLATRADVAGALGDYPEKLRLRQTALDQILKEYGDESDVAAVYRTLVADAEITLQRAEDARVNYERAGEILKALNQEDSTLYAAVLHGRAMVAESQKDYPKAIELATEALSLFAVHLGEGSLRYRDELLLLGRLHLMNGDPVAAEAPVRKSLEASQQGAGSVLTQMGLEILAQVLHNQGKDDEATSLLEQALKTHENAIASVSVYQTESQQAALMAAAREQLGWFVFVTLRRPEQHDTAYNHVLWLKGSIFARQRRLRELRSNPAAAELFDSWSRVTGSLATLAMRPPYIEDRAIWNQRIALLTADKDAIERQLLAMAKDKTPPAVTVEHVRKALPAKTALVDFLAFDLVHSQKDGAERDAQHLRAFIVRPDKTTIAQIDIKDVGELNHLINAWREALEWDRSDAYKAVQDDDEALQELFINAQETQQKVAAEIKQLLWEPLQKELEGIEHVIVSPDGPLAKFPLVALPGAQKHTYLIEDLMISSLAVPSMLPEMMAKGASAEAESLLLMGDVNYGGSAGSVATRAADKAAVARGWLPYSFSPLPGVLPEIQDIATSFSTEFPKGTKDMFVESKATEGIFRVEAPNHRWIHLATHGFYEPEIKKDAEEVRLKAQVLPGQVSESDTDLSSVLDHEGLKSGLALAGANELNREGQDDGILSAMEVSSMDLSNVEMTMLSACQTGLGESLSGEGVAGLQRAFQVAGVGSTVTTLWSVDDTAARLLAARFYRNLWERNMSKAAAMREAQSWMIAAAFRDNGKNEVPKVLTIDAEVLPGRFRLPENWAPFVLSGDWR